MATPSVDIRLMLGGVRDDVLAATGRRQQPHVYGTPGRQPIYLAEAAAVVAAPAPAAPKIDDGVADLVRAIEGMSEGAGLRSFASHRSEAVRRAAAAGLAALEREQRSQTPGPGAAIKPHCAPGSGKSFKDRQVDGRECVFCPEMVVVPAGTFDMGSNEDPSEKPVRRVTIRQPFGVGKFEIMFQEWEVCVAAGGCAHRPNDHGWDRGWRPVIDVSWIDAKQYVEWLARTTGRGYRLLSEAEWEYAARAGSTTRYHFGDTISKKKAQYSVAGYGSARQPLAVGSFPANAWGLHDMHGNASEWVEDCWSDNYNGAPLDESVRATGDCRIRVVRGGSWAGDNPKGFRAAARGRSSPGVREFGLGFRVARTLNPVP